MPSFSTISRAIIMLVVGAIVIKGWMFYGPPAEQVKSAVVSAVEMAESAWNGQPSAGDTAHASADSGGKAPPFPQMAPSAAVETPQPSSATLTQNNNSGQSTEAIPIVSMPTSQPSAPALVEPPASAAGAKNDPVPALLSRLEKLGGAEPQLATWGTSGHLYRFCCQAALADSPACTRHFESVAAEPALAVEQVVAKVEAWRTARQSDSALR